MTGTATVAQLDPAVALRLSERFANVFPTFDAGTDLFTEDVLFDLNMPVWRFQIQGPAALADQLRAIRHGPVRIDVVRTIPAYTGFMTEHVEHQDVDGEDISARKIWYCEVDNERISFAICYCTGAWDDALRARHAAEAPMVRS
jgi:hypothetical protein